jgi:cell division protein FtsA|tara:strand:- start:6382 stop:7563 length:1182 start_codon:yes stop_codon:yes gene_type:complete
MSRNLINALQVGNNSIKFITAQEIEIANQGSIIQVLAMTEKKGEWNVGNDLDTEILSSYLKSLLLENEKLAGQKINEVLVSVDEQSSSKYITHELFLNNIEITKEHINSFYNSKDFIDLYQSENQPIHTFPISYKVDERRIVSDPIGIKAQMLTVKWHIISVSREKLKNISNLLELSGIQMSQCILSSYASTLASINDMESNLGVICLDINYNKTEITIMIDNQLVYADQIEIGIKYVNKDLQDILEINEKEANQLRIKWGSDSNIKNLNEKQLHIKEIIKYRIEEIIELSQKKIINSKYYDLANSHIVVTGEGAKYYDIIELAKNIFNTKNIRIGAPQRVHGLKSIIENTSNNTCLGMLSYALSTEFQYDSKNQTSKKESVLSVLYNFFKAI